MADSKHVVNPSTGEVKKTYCSPFSHCGLKEEDYSVDLSNPFAEIFEEVPPYALDPDSGKFLNDSSQPKLISKGYVNVQEKIDSFAKEADLYSILEKFAYGEDMTLLKARPCDYGDVSIFPDNLNEYASFVNAHYKNLEGINPVLAKMIIDNNVSPADIESKANEILNERISNFNNNIDKKVEENK